MRCYTVGQGGEMEEGIRWSDAPFPNVQVGEDTPGRQWTRVPVLRGFSAALRSQGSERIMDAGVFRTVPDGQLLLLEPDARPDNRALVLVRVAGGTDGYVRWWDGWTEECRLIAEGYGSIGNCGGVEVASVERLVIVQPRSVLRVVIEKHGRSDNARVVIAWDGTALTVGTEYLWRRLPGEGLVGGYL